MTNAEKNKLIKAVRQLKAKKEGKHDLDYTIYNNALNAVIGLLLNWN